MPVFSGGAVLTAGVTKAFDSVTLDFKPHKITHIRVWCTSSPGANNFFRVVIAKIKAGVQVGVYWSSWAFKDILDYPLEIIVSPDSPVIQLYITEVENASSFQYSLDWENVK